MNSDERDSVERDSFCVDLTVLRGGNTYWIEFKYSGAAEWADILKEAEKSVAFWEKVLLRPRSWRLVHNLGGRALVAPCGLGTLISNFVNLRLDVKSEHFLLELSFPRPALAQAAPQRRPRRPRVPETRTAEDFRALKAKRDRKRQRQDVMQTGPILKKPRTRIFSFQRLWRVFNYGSFAVRHIASYRHSCKCGTIGYLL